MKGTYIFFLTATTVELVTAERSSRCDLHVMNDGIRTYAVSVYTYAYGLLRKSVSRDVATRKISIQLDPFERANLFICL